ncbi:unnamed protein product, partial [Effrenium voratum]
LQKEKRHLNRNSVQAATAENATAGENATDAQNGTAKFVGGSCDPVAPEAACCIARGKSCTNPPNPFDHSTLCPTGAVCDADIQFNPFGGPILGYCKCQFGNVCSQDGASCGVALGDPFAKCSGSVTDPIGCCNNQPSTCQNPPNPFNLSTACGLGQACDADTLSGGYGTCKCLAGTCSADGKSCSL